MNTVNVPMGCTITRGAQDWQILQRDAEGHATVQLEGTWATPPPAAGEAAASPDPSAIADPSVIVRVVRQDTGAPPTAALDWHHASTCSDGTWQHTLRLPSGGLYRIETGLQKDRVEWAVRGDFVHHLGVGELWVIAGQSNAAGYGRGPADDPVELGVHMLRNDERWALATHPLNDTRNNTHANLETWNPGHSPFLAFGRELKAALGCPIGLLQTARGATSMTAWNRIVNPDAPLYRNLLHCVGLAGGSVAGVIWHQGEGEAEMPALAPQYGSRLAELVDVLRSDLNKPQLPILVAQANRFLPACDDADRQRSWSVVREAQRQIAHRLSGVAVVSTLDLALSDLIHNGPSGNLVLAHRFAQAALAIAYGCDVAHRFPEIDHAAALDDESVVLRFTNVRQRLHWDSPPLEDFTVEDEEGEVPVRAVSLVTPAAVRLSLGRRLAHPAVVHGAYGRNPTVRMYDVGGHLPALGFYGFPVDQQVAT